MFSDEDTWNPFGKKHDYEVIWICLLSKTRASSVPVPDFKEVCLFGLQTPRAFL